MGGIECPTSSTTNSRIWRATSAVLDMGNRDVIPLTADGVLDARRGNHDRHAAPFDVVFLIIEGKSMPPHQFQVTDEVRRPGDGVGGSARQSGPLEQRADFGLGELRRDGLSKRRRVDHVAVTHTGSQANGLGALDDIKVDDVIARQNP